MSDDIISLYRERLAREKGAVKKDRGGKLAVALAYPNYYRLGMSNLGFQIVYNLLNRRSDIVAERFFLPETQEMSIYLRSGRSLLSLESQTALQSFDLVAFSLSFENDYPNILNILEMGKIPLLSEDRYYPCPFIMAGGVASFLNPEPLAIFIDFFLVGEAEANLDKFIDFFINIRSGRFTREETILALARNMQSLYAPSLYAVDYHRDGRLKSVSPKADGLPEKIRPAYLSEVRAPDGGAPRSVIRTPDTEFGDRILIELGRGCGRSCRFCAAGFVYRPPRTNTAEGLTTTVDSAMEDCKQLGLLSAAVSDVPGIEELTDRIIKMGGSFSVSSLRAESLTKRLLENLKRAGQKTIAIAPEAGTERLRKVINKHLTESQIMEAVSLIAGVKDFSLRLYFLIGLPTETMDDVAGIVNLVKAIRHHMIKDSATRGTIGQIRLSINCFIPKPFTPFQWFDLEQVSLLKEKQKWLKKKLAKEGGIRVNTDLSRWAYVQTLLSIGDRRVGFILQRVHESRGDWRNGLRYSDVNPDFFVYRPKGLDELLPWDFIDHGINKKFLQNEYALALRAEESDICRIGECFRCGVCRRIDKY